MLVVMMINIELTLLQHIKEKGRYTRVQWEEVRQAYPDK